MTDSTTAENMSSEKSQMTPEEAVEAWRSRGSLRTLCGHKIFAVDEGEKNLPVIFLIHGFPTSSWDWLGIWEELRKKHRLVALDMLGFGFSDKPDERTYTIHGQADICEALIRDLKLDKFHILAHDYGDTVAQELLARQIDGTGAGTVISCTFLNGGLFPETHRALLMQKLLLSPLGPLLNCFLGFSKFSDTFGGVFGSDTQPSEFELLTFWLLINENDGKHVFYNCITYMNDRLEHRERWVNAVQNPSCPVALINGSADPISGKHMVQRFQELKCRQDYLAEMPPIGHYPQVEAPDQVLEHFQKFLASL